MWFGHYCQINFFLFSTSKLFQHHHFLHTYMYKRPIFLGHFLLNLFILSNIKHVYVDLSISDVLEG